MNKDLKIFIHDTSERNLVLFKFFNFIKLLLNKIKLSFILFSQVFKASKKLNFGGLSKFFNFIKLLRPLLCNAKGQVFGGF